MISKNTRLTFRHRLMVHAGCMISIGYYARREVVMRSRQVTAVFLSILLAASACVPLNGAGAYAAESVEAVQEEDTAAQDPAPEQLSDAPEEQSPEEVGADEAAEAAEEAVITEAGDEESADVADVSGEAATAETDEADSAEADADAEETDGAESVGTEAAEADDDVESVGTKAAEVADDAEALETTGEDESAASSETSRASDEDGRSDQDEIPEIIYGDGVTEGTAREPMSAADSSVTGSEGSYASIFL